jgi:hypothetical protein
MRLNRVNRIQGHTYYAGVDIARMGDDETTIEIFDKISKHELRQVDNIIIKKAYLTDIAKRIIELNKIYNFKKIFLDDGGLGVGVFDYLLSVDTVKRKVVALNNNRRSLDVDAKQKKKILKEDLYNNLLGLMERGEITLLDDDTIYESLKSVQYEYTKSKNTATRLRIFGNYTHVTEGIIRAAWSTTDKTLNIWCR